MKYFVIPVFFCVLITYISYGQTAGFEAEQFLEDANQAEADCEDQSDACFVKCAFEKMDWLDSNNKLKSDIAEKITDDMLNELTDVQRTNVSLMKKCLGEKGTTVDGTEADCTGFTEMYNCLQSIIP